MHIHSYSPEQMADFRAYAASLGPTPAPEYKVIHNWEPCIKVPRGCLPMKIAQFFLDEYSTNDARAYHWAIFVPTSPRRGTGIFYEIIGSREHGYSSRRVIQSRHPYWDRYEKGTHLVGFVAPTFLETLEKHFASIAVDQKLADWDTKHWVVDALKGLDHAQMYAVQLDYKLWRQQMAIVEDAWEVGDA